MAVEFRCEKCGKVLSAEGTGQAKIKCPYCKAKVAIPAGLASLPRPQVPPGASAPPPPPPPQQQQPEAADQPGQQDDALMKVMAMVMPWVISLFFHVGVVVILGFITIVLIQSPTAEGDATIPDAQLSADLGGQIDPGDSDPDKQARDMQQVQQNKWAQRDSMMPTPNLGQTDKRVRVIGVAGPSGAASSGAFGLVTGGSGGPKSSFFGTGGNAYHIVYVVDRSGSMLDTLDLVKQEIRRSVSRLSQEQTFHVIFFSGGKPMENPPGRLVYATEKYRREAFDYLDGIRAQGQTDPIPALARAFQVLERTPNAKRGKLIYLLTDGEFRDNDKVLKEIKRLNSGGQVHINTILHHHESRFAVKVLKSIAKENGGRFRFVAPNE